MDIDKVLSTIHSKGLEAGRRFAARCMAFNRVPEHTSHYCRDCGAYTEYCVVEDWVWANIHKPQDSDIALCPHCMEKRLGRKLTLKDLKEVPCNAPYFIGFQMSRF